MMLSAIAFATVFVWSLSHVHLAVVFLATSLVLEYLVQARGRRVRCAAHRIAIRKKKHIAPCKRSRRSPRPRRDHRRALATESR